MESILSFAEELERRDATVARALEAVELQQAQVEELRLRAADVAAFLERLPRALAEREAEERAAGEGLARAEAAQREAEEGDPVAASAVRAATGRCERAREASALLAHDAELQRAEAGRLASRAAELAPGVHVPAPSPGLDGAIEWGSLARGALLLERAALAREREEIVREASELVASVLGEPLTAVSVAGLKDRLSA